MILHELAEWARAVLNRIDPPYDAPRHGAVVIATADGHSAAFSGGALISVINEAPPLPKLDDIIRPFEPSRTGVVVKLRENLAEVPPWLRERMGAIVCH